MKGRNFCRSCTHTLVDSFLNSLGKLLANKRKLSSVTLWVESEIVLANDDEAISLIKTRIKK